MGVYLFMSKKISPTSSKNSCEARVEGLYTPKYSMLEVRAKDIYAKQV